MEQNTTFIENNVFIKDQNGKVKGELKQKVSLDTSTNAHELEFIGEFPTADGKDVVEESIFNVDAKPDGSYSINIAKTDIFKNEEGKSFLESAGLAANDGKITLKMDPENSSIDMSSNGEELVFNFTGSDGKEYKITTGAVGISVEYDGKVYSYSTQNKSAIGVKINDKMIEGFLDKNNKICKTPSNIVRDFPSYLIGLYATNLKGNTQTTFGDYTITSIDMEGEKAEQPYIFVTKTNPKNKSQTNYFFINGELKRCNEFLCQYNLVGDVKETPSVILEVKPQRISTNTVPAYYQLPIKLDENGKIAESSIKAIELLQNISHMDDTNRGKEEPYVLESSTDNKVQINFFKKDEREYAKNYHFRLKPKKIYIEGESNAVEDSNVENAFSTSFIYETSDSSYNIIPPSTPSITKPYQTNDDDGENGNPAPEDVNGNDSENPSVNEQVDQPEEGDLNNNPQENDIEQGNQDQATEDEKEIEKEKETEEEPKKPKKIKAKGFIEGLSDISIYVGIFLAVGAMLTGFGLLAGIGLGLTAGGLVGSQIADKVVFHGPIKKARKKIKEFEQEELEEGKFVENFTYQEALLDAASDLSAERENKLSATMKQEGSIINNFVKAYNEYGIGFEGSLDEGQERVDALISYRGLERKQTINDSLLQIKKTSNVKEKNKLINNFINLNFENLPVNQVDEIREMFDVKNRAALNEFTTALTQTISAQQSQAEIYEAQKETLSKSKDKQIHKIVNSKNFNTARRASFFERYSPILVRHYTNDKNLTVAKIDKLVKDLSNEDKEIAFNHLQQSAADIESHIQNVAVLAEENREKIARLKECSSFLKAMAAVDSANLAITKKSNGVIDFINKHVPNSADREKVKELFSSHIGDAKSGLRNSLKQIFGNKKLLHTDLTYSEVLNLEEVAPKGKIDIEKATSYINGQIKMVNKHSRMNLYAMDTTLGHEFAKNEYARRKEDIIEGRTKNQKFDNEIELLVNRFGLNEAKLRSEINSGNTTVNKLLNKFGIDIEAFRKEQRKVNNSKIAYSKKDKKTIEEETKNLENFSNHAKAFDDAWEKATHGNIHPLLVLIQKADNDKEVKKALKQLHINPQEILNAIPTPKKSIANKEEIMEAVENLLKIEDKQKLSMRKERILKQKSDQIEKLKTQLALPSKSDKNLDQAKKAQAEHQDLTDEFKAKIIAIVNLQYKRYSEEEINEAFEAFANGDQEYFLCHPEIVCEDFDFSELDPQLLKKLGVKKKDLTSKKRLSKLRELNAKFAKEQKELDAKVKKAEKEATKSSSRTDDLEKVKKSGENNAKDKVSFFGKIIEKLFTKHKEDVAKKEIEESALKQSAKKNVNENEKEETNEEEQEK